MPTVVSKDGTTIAYEGTGAGPPLVLVSGALGTKDAGWTKGMVAELAKHFTVYNYDRRGRGGSGDTPPYAVQREVEDLAAVAHAAGAPPVVLGLSSGAALALEAAAAGVAMRKLVVYEPPYMVGNPPDAPPPDYEARMRALIAGGKRDEAVAFFIRTVGVPGLMLAVMRILPFWKDMRAVAHTLPYDAAVMGGFALPTKRLAAITVPTLAAAGGKTTPTLKKAAEAVAQAVPGAQHRELPGQNHAVKPKAIAPVVAEFAGRGA